MKITFHKADGTAIEFEKFNPYHGRDGRFTSANGATMFTYRPGASRSHDKAIAWEKERTARTVGGFTANMSPIARGKAEKTLNKKSLYPDGKVRTEAQFMEESVKAGRKIEAQKEVNRKLISLRYKNKPEQFDYIQRKEGARNNQYSDFVRGKYNSPLAEYFRTGDTSNLPASEAKTKYYVYTGDKISIETTKTGYDYAQYLKKQPNTKPNRTGKSKGRNSAAIQDKRNEPRKAKQQGSSAYHDDKTSQMSFDDFNYGKDEGEYLPF